MVEFVFLRHLTMFYPPAGLLKNGNSQSRNGQTPQESMRLKVNPLDRMKSVISSHYLEDKYCDETNI